MGQDATHSLISELERRLGESREAALEGATGRLGEAVAFDRRTEEGEEKDDDEVDDVVSPETAASTR